MIDLFEATPRPASIIIEDEECLRALVSGAKPSTLSSDIKYILFKTFNAHIMPVCGQLFPFKIGGYHGAKHTRQVGRFALDISLSNDWNPIPALLAAAIHDRARTDDSYDEQHGPDAVPISKALLAGPFKNWLDETQKGCVCEAISFHTTGETATEPIAATLWDSDRIRLSWERVYKPEYFSTTRGKELAGMSKIQQSAYEADWQKFQIRLDSENAQ